MASESLLLMLLASAQVATSHQTSDKMSGVHLLVSAVTELPTLAIVKDPQNATILHYSGITKEILDWFSHRLNFEYTFVPIPENITKVKGTAAAAIEYFREKKVDLVSSFLIPTAERYQFMDFIYPLIFSEYRLVQPMPGFQGRLFASVKPFQAQTWLWICISWIAVGSMFTLYQFLKTDNVSGRFFEKIGKNFIDAFSLLTGQGENFIPTQNVVRMVAVGWCLAAVVLVNVYNGKLVSFLTVPKFETVVNSFDELAHSKTLQLALPRGMIIAQFCLDAESGIFKTLGDSLRKNPHHLTSNDKEMFQLLYTGCCAFAAPVQLADMYVFMAVTESGQCRLTGSRSVGFFNFFSFGLIKGSKYNNLINQESQLLRQTGLIIKWGKTSVKRKDKCSDRLVDRARNIRIGVTELSSAFIIYAVGCTVSAISFIFEHVTRWRANRMAEERSRINNFAFQ